MGGREIEIESKRLKLRDQSTLRKLRRLARACGGIAMLMLTVAAQPTVALTGTWTNYTAGGNLTGYWTNTTSWTGVSYPGVGGTDSAYLTNQVALAYTNILDAKINNAIVNLAISNALGEAWLVVTNTALTNSTSLALHNGGRLQIDNGGTVRANSGFTWGGTNGAIYLNNGGQLFTAGALTMSGGTTGLVTSASGTGNGGVWNRNAQALAIGNSTDNNLLRITDGAVVTNSGGISLSGNRNSLLVTSGGKLFGAGAITFGTSGNTFTLEDGFWTHSAAALTINGSSNALNILGGTVSNVVGGLTVGGAAGANFNSLIVTNGGRLIMGGGIIRVGATVNPANPGGSDNTVILSNSVLLSGSDAHYIGLGSSNNAMTVLGQTLWNGGNQFLIVGWAGATNNALTVSGATLTNFNSLRVGASGNSVSNQMIIKDGAQAFVTGSANIGIHTSDSNNKFNSLIVSNGGQLFVGAGLTLGSTGGTGNTLRVTDGGQLFGAGVISFGAAENTFTFGSGFWTHSAGTALTIGGYSNAFNIVGGVVSNAGGLVVGNAPGSDFNRLIVTNGGRLILGAGNIKIGSTSAGVGGPGGSYNTVILSNSVLSGVSGGDHYIGVSSSHNTMTLLEQTAWNGAGQWLIVGTTTATNNLLTVSGATLTNFGALRVGVQGNSVSNQMIIRDGAQVFTHGSAQVGFNQSDTFNKFNSLVISNDSQLSVATAVFLGTTGGTGNTIRVTDGGRLIAGGNVTVGAANTPGNSLLIEDGGLIQALSLQIVGTDNTISNRNGTYQFTNAPTAITAGGNITITDGTISFRTTGAANVATNATNLIRNISYAGANTFMLNNASNTTAGVSQTYTFDAIAGNPSNFAHLVMVNGTTAYQNANGANLAIGANGSLLISNTHATLTGIVTNNGVVTSVSSLGTFQSAVVNRSVWHTGLSTNVFLSSHTVTTNGYISASAGDVFGFRNGLENRSTNSLTWQTLNMTPGTNTVGTGTLFEFAGTSVTQTQVFTHPGLLLTGGFDGGPVVGSNAVQNVTSFVDVAGFQANFALGQLSLTNTTLVLTQAVAGAGALFVNDLFLLDAGNTHLVIADNMRLYFVNSNGWDMANVTLLGNAEIHQLTLIPEPGALALTMVGLGALWVLGRWRRRLRL